ncbi:hypothetical protein [Ewingella americana]|uniref:Uncharacterized protein n=1 Tax=Ewingella americana TaxID=41202 RepID=A0A502GDU4_9GAMM|nr:hypothetical protein [Ewingella americana]TPG60034.1 hypothetical protein EAH77_15820 [Ewingella americana]
MSSFIKTQELLRHNALIEEVLGESDAKKFQDLLYRIILGLEDQPHEFYSEQRALKPGSKQYEALQTYRRITYQDPQISRMWRAAHTFIQERKFETVQAAAAFFMVCPDDLQSVVNYWESIGSPSLMDTFLITHRRILDEQVTPERVNPTQSMWRALSSAVRVAINNDNLRYLTQQGFIDEESLAHNCLCAGIQHAMTLDFLPEQERIALSRTRVNQYLIDQAKYLTARGRSRNEVYHTASGQKQFQRREFSFEEMAFDGSIDKIEASRDQQAAFVLDDPEYTLLLQKLQTILTPMEYRLVYNLMVDVDDEIETLLEGESLENWFEWTCNKMGVSFIKLASKMADALGKEKIACLFS